MSLSAYLRRTNSTPTTFLSRVSDLFLTAGIVAIIALMVLPLPSLMIDGLVAINISSGVVLLLVAIYVVSPLQFSVFPSLLLITTLFRLSISIATTRMILLEGDAGQIIDTFGTLVAGGNLVVGLVVFLIITVVQFIVIAKGAERVAEVSARFSLDAMPGKQLSIDSDLRSGLIDKDEARRRRRELENESKLHGSLDGAMKFVKGDAIAGIVIIVINLLGGLGVGVLQQGMDIASAMVKYSILTIGDGMVAQIPALLGAMAAGLIVTRTTDGEDDRHLGDSIQRQLTNKPRVMVIAGGICWLMALVPGFPGEVFLVVGAVLLAMGLLRSPEFINRFRSTAAFESVLRQKQTATTQVQADGAAEIRSAVPLLFQLSEGVEREKSAAIIAGVKDIIGEMQLDLGIGLPAVEIHWRSDGDPGWNLLATEVPIAGGSLAEQSADEVLSAIRQALRREAKEFVGIQEAASLLNRAGRDYPEVVKEVMRAIPMQRLAEIFRGLIQEEVPLRNLRGILETLADVGQREKDTVVLTEYARMSLRRQLCYRYAPQNKLRAVVLTPALEESLRQPNRNMAGVQQLAVDPRNAKELMDALAAAIKKHSPGAIVASADLRRHIRNMIHAEFFHVPVLSHHELLPTVDVEVVERIGPLAGPKLSVA